MDATRFAIHPHESGRGLVYSRPARVLSRPRNFSSRRRFIEEPSLDRPLQNVVLRAFSSVHRAIVHRGIIYRRRMTKHNLHRRLRIAKWAAVWSIVRVAVNVDSLVFRSRVWACAYMSVYGYACDLVAFLYAMRIHATRKDIVARAILVSDSRGVKNKIVTARIQSQAWDVLCFSWIVTFQV